MDSNAVDLIQQALDAGKSGDRSKAKKLLAKSVRLDPGNARAWYLLSQVVDDQQQALFCLEKALEIQPKNVKVQQRLAHTKTGVEDSKPDQVSVQTEQPSQASSPVPEQQTPSPVQPAPNPQTPVRPYARPLDDSSDKAGRNIIIIALVIAALFFCCCGSCWYLNTLNYEDFLSFADLTSGETRTVTYRVEGTADRAYMTFTNAEGGVEERDAELNWWKRFQVDQPAYLSVSAQSDANNGTISCEIEIDGETWESSQSSGSYAIVTCEGFFMP